MVDRNMNLTTFLETNLTTVLRYLKNYYLFKGWEKWGMIGNRDGVFGGVIKMF